MIRLEGAAVVAHKRSRGRTDAAGKRETMMGEKELRAMLDHASQFCETIFAQKGEIAPMWHAVQSTGESFVELHPSGPLGKDLASAMIRAQFEILDVVRCIYLGEGWTVDQRGEPGDVNVAAAEEAARRGKLHLHPGRIEIVMLMGEDYDAGMISAQREIIRPPHRKPYLGPLKIVVQPGDGVSSVGRMVGMLPAKGKRQ